MFTREGVSAMQGGHQLAREVQNDDLSPKLTERDLVFCVLDGEVPGNSTDAFRARTAVRNPDKISSTTKAASCPEPAFIELECRASTGPQR